MSSYPQMDQATREILEELARQSALMKEAKLEPKKLFNGWTIYEKRQKTTSGQAMWIPLGSEEFDDLVVYTNYPDADDAITALVLSGIDRRDLIIKALYAEEDGRMIIPGGIFDEEIKSWTA